MFLFHWYIDFNVIDEILSVWFEQQQKMTILSDIQYVARSCFVLD